MRTYAHRRNAHRTIAIHGHYFAHRRSVSSIKIFGVNVSGSLSVCGHVDNVITSCAHSIQAMRILRAHGMAASTIHVIFNAVVVAKLTYAASWWWGFTTAEDRQRLAAVIRRGIRSGLCDPDHMSLEDLVTDADDKLFNLILYINIMFYTVYFLIVQT